MKIAKIKAISQEVAFDITVQKYGEQYRFKAVVYETPNYKVLTALNYLDWYDKPLKTTERIKVKRFIKNYFLNEGK